jgi:hypothetical protein
VLSALERMQYDITLWNGQFQHLNEFGLFASLESLATVLGEYPGPKSVVLFTMGHGPGRKYDAEFKSLASLAWESRVAFYPVDARGLFEPPT